jgi:hypothetical protein
VFILALNKNLLKSYFENDERDRWIKEGKETAQITQKLIKGILERGKFTWEDFNVIFQTIIVSKRIGTQTKIDKIKKLGIKSQIEKEIVSEISDAVGCWGSGIFSFRYHLKDEKDVKAIEDLLEKMTTLEKKESLDKAIKEFADKNIKGIQAGVLSPILYCLHPTIYPVLNSPSIKAMEELLDKQFTGKLVNYIEEAEDFRQFRENKKLKDDFRDLDTFLYMYLEGYFSDKEDEELSEVTDPEFEIISLPVDLEKTLRKYIANNSDIIEKGLELISEDKPIRPDSKIRPDLVFRKSNDNILIIETKKGRPGSRTTLQIVNYIAEAISTYDKNNDEVELILICHEDHVDKTTDNALKVIPNISLKTYQVDFRINDYQLEY